MRNNLALLGGEKVRKTPFVFNAVLGEEEKSNVEEVLESGKLSGFIGKAGPDFFGGKYVKKLESLTKDYFNVRNSIALNSATAGLHTALAACEIAPGDEVIVTPYTMSASATAIVMTGAIPIFADIEDETFGLDPEQVEKKITPQTRAIVVVHLFGHPARMDEIMAIARKHKLYVIEDCAQAPAAIYKNRFVGTIGDIGVFSLNQHKTITSGEGGFAITNNDDLALRMQLIRNHGEAVVDDMKVEDVSNIIGYNYRMTELEAAVAVGQFKRLDELTDYRLELVDYLKNKLLNFEGLSLPVQKKDNKHVYFVFPIKFDQSKVGVSRDLFVKALLAEGIPFGAGYVRPIYWEPMYQKKIAYGKSGFPFKYKINGKEIDYSKGICPSTELLYSEKLMITGVCKYPHEKKDIDDVYIAFEKIYNNINELRKHNSR
jgi:dTDP-4-amino-4,6-dideoxygalactose transaminase